MNREQLRTISRIGPDFHIEVTDELLKRCPLKERGALGGMMLSTGDGLRVKDSDTSSSVTFSNEATRSQLLIVADQLRRTTNILRREFTFCGIAAEAHSLIDAINDALIRNACGRGVGTFGGWAMHHHRAVVRVPTPS